MVLQAGDGQRADPVLQLRERQNRSCNTSVRRDGHAAICSEPKAQSMRNIDNAVRSKHWILVSIQLEKDDGRATIPRAFRKFPRIAETVRSISQVDQ
jgi:hypothetical protein